MGTRDIYGESTTGQSSLKFCLPGLKSKIFKYYFDPAAERSLSSFHGRIIAVGVPGTGVTTRDTPPSVSP